MKIRLANLPWGIAGILLAIGVIGAVLLLRGPNPEEKALAETRQSLRQQGFKTDLADFNFSTPPEIRSREDILNATVSRRGRPQPFGNEPDLMESLGTNSAIVMWKLADVKMREIYTGFNSDELSWEEFAAAINANQAQLDAACAAILSGPIRFNLDASRGGAMLLPHLAMLKDLTQALADRAMIDVHSGDLNGAWTNLMAATRLVTAWEIEPVEISQQVRFGNTSLAFHAIWQALQTNGWTDEQLARLQAEWESADFFTNLPETAAFERASDANMCERERATASGPFPAMTGLVRGGLQYLAALWAELKARQNRADYRSHGSYEDEKAVLLFYRDRELELRSAVKCPTWSAMRQIPGVENAPPFQSKYRSRLQTVMHARELRRHFQSEGASLAGSAAMAEAEKRLIVSAIALERYRVKHGEYPQTLAILSPEYLKNPPVDFMDGRPLRYRPAGDGHFILYAIGLDCVDHGGQMPASAQQGPRNFMRRPFGALPQADIVWPLAASTAAAEGVRAGEEAAEAQRIDQLQDRLAEEQWDQAARRQADVEQLLAAAQPQNPPDVNYHGRPLSEVLRNGTNQLPLRQMFSLNQILTGAEPETVTFQLPVSYDVATNIGQMFLLIDPATKNDSDEGSLVQQMECGRAGNGDCLLVWSTIYESPGKHALQAGLAVNDLPPETQGIIGPLLSFTITNLCQFSIASAQFDPRTGATWRAKLPESDCNYTIDLNTTNSVLLKTIAGSTSDGMIKAHWDLIDRENRRFTNNFFNSVFHLTFPDSGRSQTLNGP